MSVPATAVTPELSPHEHSVLILAPFGQDAALISHLLTSAAIEVQCASDMESFAQRLLSCAVGLLTTEVLSPEGIALLQSVLHTQPSWSDIPLILLTGSMDAPTYTLLTRTLGNVTIIQRPLEAASLLTLVQTAVRARHKQYEIRDLLEAGEKRQAEIEALNTRLRTAMTETHHRVKNNLQVITAMVEMQVLGGARMLPLAEFQRLNTHMRTLAVLHDLLTQETREDHFVQALSAGQLLEKTLSLLQQSAPNFRLESSVAEMRLPVQKASALALIANELVSNGFKYGKSKVGVRFYPEEGCAVLEVADDGSGFPVGFDPQKAAHTGLELVQMLSRHDLSGKVRFENPPEGGARVLVTVPLT